VLVVFSFANRELRINVVNMDCKPGNFRYMFIHWLFAIFYLHLFSEHIERHEVVFETFGVKITEKSWQLRGDVPEDGNCCFWAFGQKFHFQKDKIVYQIICFQGKSKKDFFPVMFKARTLYLKKTCS
jgi:hypothetical protein